MSLRRLLVIGGLVCVLIAGVLATYASSQPDGLNFVAASLGFDQAETASVTADSPLAGYDTAGVANPALSKGLSGIVGIAVVALVMTGLLMLVRRRSARERD